MIRDQITAGIISVYKHCGVLTFPLNCESLLMQYGYEIKKYSELPKKKLKACMDLSEDATTLEGTVFYNDNKPPKRIRFSLMHELGHIVLNTDNEANADTFSSNLLAPRMAIHYSKCKRAADVAKFFDLSKNAATLAFDDYLRWYSKVSVRGMSKYDRELYNHFYNDCAKKFVWKIERCEWCYQGDAYNESTLCPECKMYEIRKLYTPRVVDNLEYELDIARSNWLYGSL